MESKPRETDSQLRETDSQSRETDSQLRDANSQSRETDSHLRETDSHLRETDSQLKDRLNHKGIPVQSWCHMTWCHVTCISLFSQDLCRQHMQSKSSEKPEPLHAIAARVSSVSNSEVRSPSSRSSTSSW